MSLSQIHISDSFNEHFCKYLEYHLSRTLSKSSENNLKWLWCDGIKIPGKNQFLNQTVVEIKQIDTEAWFGNNGQDIYKMTLKLGPYSIANLIAGRPMYECIPSEESTEWIKLSVENRSIELQLK